MERISLILLQFLALPKLPLIRNCHRNQKYPLLISTQIFKMCRQMTRALWDMGSLGALVARTTNQTPISWQKEEIQYFQGLWKKFELPNKDVIEPEGAGYVTADQQTKSKWSFQPHCKALKYKLPLFNKQAQAWSWFLWNTKPLSILYKDVLELTLPKVAWFPERIAVRKFEHVACHLCHRENFTLSVSYSQLVVLA